LGVWFHLEKNVQGGPATIGGVQDNEVYGSPAPIPCTGKTFATTRPSFLLWTASSSYPAVFHTK